MNNFERRFREFIESRQDCRILDDGQRTITGKVADFLLNGENICAELKCLDQEMLQKLQVFATEIIESRDLPIYGAVPFESIIEAQPDRIKLKRDAVFKIGDRLSDDFRDANRQIRNTKKKLSLKGPGLLILANTQNHPLDPRLAVWFLKLLFNRRKEDKKTPICSAIDAILYLTEIHDIGDLDGVGLRPAVTILRAERSDYDPLKEYLDRLLEGWAAFSGIPLFVAEQPYEQIENFNRTPMQRRGLLSSSKTKPNPPYIAASFSMPALCKECGARFAHPALNESAMRIKESQTDFFVVGFVCPRCSGIADTRVADLAVDREGEIIRVYPWTGSLDDILSPDWRKFIDRSNRPNVEAPK